MPLDFPLTDVITDQSAYDWFVSILWPDGPICPHCLQSDCLTVHNRHQAPIVDYICKRDKRTFNVFRDTLFHGSKRPVAHRYIIFRGFSQGVSTNQLSRELGCRYYELLMLRHKFQDAVYAQGLRASPDLCGTIHESDEMYQNAGEKRNSPRRSGRPTAAACEQGTRARHL